MKKLALCSLWVAVATAQHQHAPPAEKPVALLKGLGNHHFPIATANPEAQKFFDQGLTLLYGFNRYEALRSFKKAAELDPKAPMPRWGTAMAQGPHINMDTDGDVQMKESCAAVDEARKLLTGASDRERAYVQAAATRCPEYVPATYREAMRKVAAQYPDDLDAKTLYVESIMVPVRWRWWTRDGKPADGMDEAVSVLEEVMRRNAEHAGANHFYIHAVEMSPSPERAVPSAQRLMGIVPAAGHLVHMPGHIWMILGRFDLAVDVNERAAEVDRQYMQTTGVMGSSYAGYYVHNLHFVAVGRSMQGRKADAVKAAAMLKEAVAPFIGEMAGMVDAFVPAPLFAQLRFGLWDDVLKAAAPDAKLPASNALRHFGRAIAFAAKGQRAEALKEQAAFESQRKQVPAEWIWLNNKASAVLDVAAASLAARLAESAEASIPLWKKAVEAEDALVYDEPPPWYYPVRESLGGALLRAGHASDAEAVFREGVRLKPGNGRMLFGLMESLKAQGKSAAASMVEREFQQAWKDADVKLSVAAL